MRIETGDELSKRAKFVLVSWVGPNVGALKKAKMSTDKAFVKEVITVRTPPPAPSPRLTGFFPQSYAKEILADKIDEVKFDVILAQVIAVGGANYGTGVRAK